MTLCAANCTFSLTCRNLAQSEFDHYETCYTLKRNLFPVRACMRWLCERLPGIQYEVRMRSDYMISIDE